MGLAESVRLLPNRTMRSTLLALSHRRSLARLAVRSPLTRSVVARFVAGQTLEEALPAIATLKQAGYHTTVDVLGESVASAEQAGAAVDQYLATVAALSGRGLDANVSVKLTQMGLEIGRDVCRDNVMRIVEALRAVNGFIRFDMEDHAATDATLEIWRAANDAYPQVGIVIQSALKRSSSDVDAITGAGGRIRLCKGAYDEPASVAYRTRAAVDGNYALLMERLLLADAHPALATHDPALIAKAIEIARREGIGPDRFEFQMLYGVRRDVQRKLIDRGFTVRIYVPYGQEWYPYYMRRLAERPANVAFMIRAIVKEEGRRIRSR
jgi:proline dehydrogenase